jgi:hypothetical protein
MIERRLNMKRKLIKIIVLTILTLSTLTVMQVSGTHHEKPIVVAHLKGALEPDKQLEAMMNLTWIDWRIVLDDITPEDLEGSKMLFLVILDSAQQYSNSELDAVSSWFDQGGKTIFVSGDSDFGNDYLRQAQYNAVFERIGSKLRIDDCQVEDAVSNGGAPYRVLGVSYNVDPQMEFLLNGVERALFHSPGPIVVNMDGEWTDLSVESIENVYILMTSSDTGVIVNQNEFSPSAMTVGSEGNFPLLVMEVDYESKNTIFASGDSPYDQYMGMYAPEIIRPDRYGANANPQQGQYLVENILKYGTTFGPTILDQASMIMGKDTVIASLEADVSGLKDEVDNVESEKSVLGSEVAALEAEITGLEADVEAAQSSASTMQLAAIAALVIGIVVGVFVGPMIKKQ